jgi:hypothetical protein
MSDVEKFKAELACAFAEIGRELGETLHCMVSAELAQIRERATLLESLLSSNGCKPITNSGELTATNPATNL